LTFAPCLVLAAVLGGNHIVCQVGNLVATPLNLASVLPFMSAGQWIVGGAPFRFSLEEFSFSLDTLREYARPIRYGVTAWMIMLPAMLAVSYAVFLPVAHALLKSTQKRSKTVPVAASPHDVEMEKKRLQKVS
jgi:uncharacterized protein (DUF2062 family)